MYLHHFALTRLPFETPAHTDELFDSNSRREAETRLNHLIELRGIGLLTERAHEVSGTSKRGRFRKNHRVPTRHHRAAPRWTHRNQSRSTAPHAPRPNGPP